MSQLKTVRVKLESVMRTAAFVRGFRESQAGKPLNYDAFPDSFETNKQWQYERGRQFGLIFTGALKNGPKLTWQAKAAYREALRQNAII